MYRLLKLNPTRSNSLTRLSLNNEREKSCHFCRLLQNYNKVSVSSRFQSTIVNPSLLLKQKVRKKRSKHFNTTELVEVSNKSTFQRMAKIKTVDANDLNKLLEMNTELNSLYRIKSPTKYSFSLEEHSYNNLTVINQSSTEEVSCFPSLSDNDQRILSMLGLHVLPPNSPSAEPSVIENLNNEETSECALEPQFIAEEYQIDRTNDILDSIPPLNSTFHPEPLEEAIESHEEEKESIEEKIDTQKKSKQVDLSAKTEIIHKTLASYVEVCAVQKQNFKAVNAIMFFQHKSINKGGVVIDNIKVFNALLKCYAAKGNWKKTYETLKMMKNDSVKHNLQTYIIILECIGRNWNKSNKYLKISDLIKKYCQEAKSKGFTFDKMMNEGIFLNDEREVVLQAMRKISPTYEPKYEHPIVQYDNELVNDLNHVDQLKPDLESCEVDGLFSRKNLEERVASQVALEKEMTITIQNIEAKEEPTEEVLKFRNSLEELYKVWSDAATEAFRRDLCSLSAKRGATNLDVYLKSIPMEDFVAIIVSEAKKLSQGSESYSPTVHMLYRDLGAKVYDRYLVLRKQQTGVLDKILSLHNQYCNYYASTHRMLDHLPTCVENLNTRQKWQWIQYQQKPNGATLDLDHNEWVPTVLTDIGKFLYHIIMHDLMVDVNSMKVNSKNRKYLPAFYTIFRSQGRIIKEEVKPHPILSKLYKSSVPVTLNFPVNEVPMLCPPIPWTSVKNGGYLITPSYMIRLPSYAIAQKQKMEKTNTQQLYPSFDSLNQLAAVPWKVNTRILDVIIEVFNTGGSSRLDVPEPPSSLPVPEPPVPVQELDKTQRSDFFKQKLVHRRKKAEMYSLRCECLYRLSLAQHFRDEIFWLPHNMDFRGRVYPIPPHLNHLGSDLARSMLVFAEPRPLGPNGLDWLKIHLINLTGLKKRDRISDRLQYANESMDLILDSADNPLNGRKWWMESEEPWQTLACCIEIAEAARSADTENFLSSYPVHQDGSCNGLQHYAALGRDKAGGFSVNLCPADVPQDVYSAVVALVEEGRKNDAKDGNQVAQLLEGFVKRKVIKQTIMTTVYGVTRFGARLQIAKQLKDLEHFPKDQVFNASNYLTSKTFESLRTMFTSTKEIQDWFTECARLISTVAGRHVEWVTPLGLPVVQPYFKYTKKLKPNSVYEPYLIDKYEKPYVMKQKNAFPPNYIHSLDSTHMMLTSLNCERAGLTFVSVHDCFWTHPSTVHIMNKICREQFVALHSQPILEDLSLFLTDTFSYSQTELKNEGPVVYATRKKMNKLLGQLPATGDLDINQVMDSVYFFS